MSSSSVQTSVRLCDELFGAAGRSAVSGVVCSTARSASGTCLSWLLNVLKVVQQAEANPVSFEM